MKADDPRHGTYAGWHAHSTTGQAACEPCRHAKRIYQRRSGKRRALGHKPRVTPNAARRHVQNLLAAGMKQEDIARASGVQRMTLHRLIAGELTYLHVSTAAKIVATQPRQRDHFRPAIGTTRRLQALVAIGYPQTVLASKLGIERTNFGNLIAGKRSEVTTTTHNDVARLFAELCMAPYNDARALGVARKHGWVVPMAWDDPDNPDEKPQGIGVPRNGRWASHAEARTADLEQFVGADMSLDEACRELGIDRDAMWKWCDRHGRRDLYERLARGQRRRNNQYTEGAA